MLSAIHCGGLCQQRDCLMPERKPLSPVGYIHPSSLYLSPPALHPPTWARTFLSPPVCAGLPWPVSPQAPPRSPSLAQTRLPLALLITPVKGLIHLCVLAAPLHSLGPHDCSGGNSSDVRGLLHLLSSLGKSVFARGSQLSTVPLHSFPHPAGPTSWSHPTSYFSKEI